LGELISDREQDAPNIFKQCQQLILEFRDLLFGNFEGTRITPGLVFPGGYWVRKKG
jgi:hypothetical protein